MVLWGVRQCGKTYILEKFGKQEFQQTHYINFEQETESLNKIFAKDLKPKRIIEELSFYIKCNIDIEHDLVIFDEIQDCPRALTSLKYFCEQMPELALCCAGSLLGLQLNAASFPVGKVDIIHMHSMSFVEFLMALGEDKSLEYLQYPLPTEIPQIVHEHLFARLKWYFVVGGLPEIVSVFIELRTNLFNALTIVREQQQTLIKEYYADIAKHAGKVDAMHIMRVWQNVPAQLAANYDATTAKFKFKGIVSGIDRYARLANTIDWLVAAHHVIKIPIVNSGELPLSAYTKESNFKLYMFDVGILGAMSNLPPKTILDQQYNTYKGYFAENFVAQQLILANTDNLYSWQDSRAEVEFLQILDDGVIPIEVKSGKIIKAKSLAKFIAKYSPEYSVVYSARNMSIDKTSKTYRYPLYFAGVE